MPALKVIYFSSFCYFTIKLVCLTLHAGNCVFMLLHSHEMKTVRTSRFVIFSSGLLAPKDSSSSPLSLNSHSSQKYQQNRLKGAAENFSSELLASSHTAPQLSTASRFVSSSSRHTHSFQDIQNSHTLEFISETPVFILPMLRYPFLQFVMELYVLQYTKETDTASLNKLCFVETEMSKSHHFV